MSTISTYYDVVVAGGGAAGLSSAIALAQKGLTVLVLGAPVEIRDDGRSAALFQSSLDFLDTLGLGDDLRAAGAPLAAIRIIDIAGGLVRAPSVTFKAAEIGQDVFGWNIPNAQILRVMIDKAGKTPGLTLSPGFFGGFETTDHGLRITLQDGHPVETCILIGADGQKSGVRAAAGIGTRARPYPQTAITCQLRHTKDHEDTSLEFHTREGPFTFVPVGDHRCALVWIMKPEKAEAVLQEDRALLGARITQLSSSLLGHVTIDGPMGAVPLQKMVADRLTAPRLALVGEAAHAFPPIGAQGLNLGLKDVEALVDLVAKAHGRGEDIGLSPISDYAKARKLDVEMRTAGVDLMNTALIADRFPLDLARAAGLSLLKDIGPLRRLAMRIGGWQSPFLTSQR